MTLLPTNLVIIFKLLIHILLTTDGYSVAAAGLKPTKAIIERDCRDPTFVPSYCPKHVTAAEEEDDTIRKYSSKTKLENTGEMSMDCLGLPSDAQDCPTEPGSDYANERQKETRNKNSNKKKYGKNNSNKVKKGLTQTDTEKGRTSAEGFLSSNETEKLNKRIKERLESIGGEMEMECMGSPWDPQHCTDTATKTPKATQSPKAAQYPRAPQAKKSTKTPQPPQAKNASKAPKAPKALKASKAPKNPNTKYSVRKLNNVGEIRGEAETECLGLPSDPDNCHTYANKEDYEKPNGDDYEMANGDDYEMANGDDYEMANGDDYEMANGDDYEMAKGDNLLYGKGKAKAAILMKNGRLYLQFGARAEANKKHVRLNKVEKGHNADQDYQMEMGGGNGAWPDNVFPWIVRIIGGCVDGECGGSLISPRLILSAFHCTYNHAYDDCDKPCDHSDEKRLAYLGRNTFYYSEMSDYYSIPIIDVKYPRNQGYKEEDDKSHDFAMLVLKNAATFSPKIKPICLPTQDQDFGGKPAEAAGWGMDGPDVNPKQSSWLISVDLFVSKMKYDHSKMFGTELSTNLMGDYKDACSGDSGGPLMYLEPELDQWIIIGTVMGRGYSCKDDTVLESEGSTNGLWNKVSVWVDWINKVMKEMGEKGCKDQEEYNKISQW